MEFKKISEDNRFSREIIIVIKLDGTIIDITYNCFTILGYKKEEMAGHKITEFMNQEMDLNLITKKFNGESVEIVLKNKNDNLIYMDVMVYALFDENKVISSLCLSMSNITKYKNLEDKVKSLIKIFEGSNDIICSFRVVPSIKLNYISPAIITNLGYCIEEIETNPMLLLEIAHPDDYEFQIGKINGDIDYSLNYEKRYKNKNGSYIWFEEYVVPVYDEEGDFIAFECILRNIEDRKELEEKLERFSYYDSLTGIYNKRYFQKEINRLNNDIDVKLGIIICDLDNLKYVNDTFGHAEGDIVLKQTALLLSKPLNEDAVIARIGGDEFAILLKDLSREEFINIYDKIKDFIWNYNNNKPKNPIQISIGIAYSESSIGFTENLFKTADKNMYSNKNNKKKSRKSR